MRYGLLVAVGLVALPTCSSGGAATATTSIPPGAVAANATIQRVVDGDTVVARFDHTTERVRLIGIDTPESVKPNTPVQCYGKEASTFTASLLPVGTRVRIERDVEARDAYDRLLGYIVRADDGLFVNLEIVRQGYARPLTIAPNVAHVTDFVAAAQAAEAADIGLWSACGHR
jgi:micrococcal nuclease